MKIKYLLSTCTLALTLGLNHTVVAEDIDLFMENPAVSADLPNVLFMIDNSANWNSNLGGMTKMELVHEALYDTVTDVKFTDRVNVGLEIFSKGNSPKGGKIFTAVNKLTAAEQATWKTRLYDTGLKTGTELLPKTNNAPYALMMNEALLYYRGAAPESGIQDGAYKATNPGKNLEGYDPAAVSGGNYVSPTPAGSCGKKYIILIGNGEPDNGENNTAEAKLAALGGDTTVVPVTPNNFQANMSDEYSRYMASGIDEVVTYVIDVHNPNSNQRNTNKFKGARAWLKSIANQGEGKYYTAETSAELATALTEILDEIQAVNSVFASTTLPVSVNVRGTHLNQVYMGVFRPDAKAQPSWLGNLKLYQLDYDSGTSTLFLADSVGTAAQSPTTGFITNNAISFWTTTSTFWDFDPRGTPESGSDLPDGEVVEKGAAAQHLREDYPTRNLYTCTGACTINSSLSATPFASSNASITQSALGAADATEKNNIINWVRGEDNMDEDGDTVTNEVRPSIHGDVLHSQPAVINYNRNGDDNDVIIYYGSNDGVFHAVQGGKLANATTGDELWGFVPQEFFGKLKRLRDNTPKIWTTSTPTNPRRDYFVDGPIGVYQYDANDDGTLDYNDGDKVYIYPSMRRGGRLLYALDVSDPTNPKLLWKKDNTSTGYGELGQTWSLPHVANINLNGSSTPVLIMGAGYDAAAEDAEPATVDTMGRGIMVINALNGQVIWQAGPSPAGATYNKTVAAMTYSIPSDIATLDRDRDANNYADLLYVGDTGGNLWRADIGDQNPNNWTVTKLADLGSTGADARKFLYSPDVVYESGYDAILIGSGDREHPFDTTITNRFYMLKDTSSGTTITESDLYDATANRIQDGNDAEQAAAATSLGAAKGWYITLAAGEKNVGGALTLSGSTFFSTNQPAASAPGSCSSNLGIARTYIVSYLDASATTEQDNTGGLSAPDRMTITPGGGFTPTGVASFVEIDGQIHEAVIAGPNVHQISGDPLQARRRVYWYKEIE